MSVGNLNFPHRDEEFEKLLRIVAERRGFSMGLVEKDYWVTHTLWALHTAGFEIWFKGGTSLSKGFGLIKRFSEDLDLRIDPGTVSGLVLPQNWTSGSRGQVKKRRAYFESLKGKLSIPDVEVRSCLTDGRSAEYEAHYPGVHHDDVKASGMRPFVLIEAGRARVEPYVLRDMSSFVHDLLREQGHTELQGNVPIGVRCVHPVVTLLDKLDALSNKYEKGAEAAAYARHYEDAADIVQGASGLPPVKQTPSELAQEMLRARDIRRIPNAADEAFSPEPGRRAAIARACAKMSAMYWSDRTPVAECCEIIKEWIAANLES